MGGVDVNVKYEVGVFPKGIKWCLNSEFTKLKNKNKTDHVKYDRGFSLFEASS